MIVDLLSCSSTKNKTVSEGSVQFVYFENINATGYAVKALLCKPEGCGFDALWGP
jgi:hypothetical protein